MDKITEEVFTSIIKRIENLEEKVGIGILFKNTSNQTPENKGTLATPGQIKFIKGLGGRTWNGMSKSEASKLIDELQRKKTPKQKKELPQEDLDYPMSSNPLTQEEINELGEDALL